MDGFARLLIQFLKIRQAQAPYVEVSESCLTNRETCNPQVVNAVAAAVQKAGAFQVRQKTVDRARRQPRRHRNLLRSESARRFTEELKQTQPPLQRRDVVTSFRSISHTHPKSAEQNESANYLMKVIFLQQISCLTAGRTSLPHPRSISVVRLRHTSSAP